MTNEADEPNLRETGVVLVARHLTQKRELTRQQVRRALGPKRRALLDEVVAELVASGLARKVGAQHGSWHLALVADDDADEHQHANSTDTADSGAEPGGRRSSVPGYGVCLDRIGVLYRLADQLLGERGGPDPGDFRQIRLAIARLDELAERDAERTQTATVLAIRRRRGVS